ncbi:NAD(P)-dependent oxidoreductase [Microvirga sp. BT689]|uniref:NAD-dependent epimerase/dehydratase family protein n=1 Tax=Microvirga arvi TaxID=2778731 RepID=UPI0019502D30|nr:NAD(P)-dependent oxidoreductase [Microvirga arvi]MBM6581882.1 NAD(P)-dependent oxidoreductase [Microvirga arvi]
MRILVTGAFGFVGTHLVRGLTETFPQARIIASDRMSPPPAIAAYWTSAGSRITTAILDVADRRVVQSIMDDVHPTHVVHAAALTPTLEQEREAPDRIVDVNIGGTFAVVDAATRLSGLRRVVTVSSGAVYGQGQSFTGLVDENEPPRPDNLYGLSKLASEGITARLGELRGVSTASVRLASVYGEMERATAARHRTSLVHRLAAAQQPIAVSAADVVRDWVHADDVAWAVSALLEDRPLQWSLYHIGGGEPTGWRKIIQAFQAAGRPIAWASDDEAADIQVAERDARPVFSIDRLATETGFRPRSIEDGIANMIRQGKASA